jgi:hypothetical protein
MGLVELVLVQVCSCALEVADGPILCLDPGLELTPAIFGGVERIAQGFQRPIETVGVCGWPGCSWRALESTNGVG